MTPSQHGYSIAHLGVIYAKETGDRAPSHQAIYQMTLRGDIPAEFINGRWYVAEANKPLAIEAIKTIRQRQAAYRRAFA